MTKTLPAHLVGMTQEKWDRLSPRRRAELVDTSCLHPKLVGLEGQTVTVTPPRPEGCLSTFKVGRSSGWQPVHLAMKRNQIGSSDLIGADEAFDVQVIR